ncbi:hypothetical protein BS78_K286400 [Paspalum vaginatum]|uniref:AAA+ ATPase domain-containing protein n=1 Tax=Paspalum vaginatum TaxID=158149 RepID=A0A9W8CGJ9_9POAL|nr:hypothetical protein BS78_K286400 [Paspalum vaginatum]
MMEPVTSAIGLVDKSLELIGTLSEFYTKHAKVPEGIVAIRDDLVYIDEAITNERRWMSWMNDLRRIKLRIEDVVEFYVAVNKRSSLELEGLLAGVVEAKFGTKRGLPRYLEEIQDLSKKARERAETYLRQVSQQGQAASTSSGNMEDKEEGFINEMVDGPLGLETTIYRDLLEKLRDGTQLTVVAVSSPDARGGSELAKAAYDTILHKEAFACSAWVPVTDQSHHNGGGEQLLNDILFGLGWQRQEAGSSPSQLTTILKDFLKTKRYIIGIDGLQTLSYWDAVLSAFPVDDYTSSRIIVTTTQDEIAQICHKNCPVYHAKNSRMRPPYTQSFDLEEVVQILCTGTARKRRMVTITGPGGSGKSVLAKAVYEKIQTEEEFRFKASVTPLPHHKEPHKKLLLDIIHKMVDKKDQQLIIEEVQNLLSNVTSLPHHEEPHNKFQPIRDMIDRMMYIKDSEGKSSQELIQELKKLLSNERYIILIDGLETQQDLSNVTSVCPEDNIGGMIIVTTTNDEVVNLCEGHATIYKMQPLDAHYARNLLVKEVFPKNESVVKYISTINMILETCEYLPLAIANMGKYMKSSNICCDNYSKCEKACINIGSLFGKSDAFRGMMHMLDRSYTRLSDDAKACLLSLSICFKDLVIENCGIKDHVIKRKPLIRRLIAEKLISSEEGTANKCFTELINHNFIVPVEFSINREVKTFRVNRMMPQFINGKVDYENYVTWIDTQQGNVLNSSHTDITRLCLHNTSIESDTQIVDNIDISHVRLLTFHGNASKALMNFSDYTFLRVLILENCVNMKNAHLDTIGNQQILRYLSIRGNKDVTQLPENIVNMPSLETLDTRGTSVQEISMDVILLPELLHLFGEFQIIVTNKNSKRQRFKNLVAFRNNDTRPPTEKSKLQTISGFLIDEGSGLIKLFPCMPTLRKVRIWCRKTPPSDKVITELLEALKSLFQNKDGKAEPIDSLSLDFGDYRKDFLEDLKVESARPLLSLKLHGKLTKFPRFLQPFSDCLKELCLSGGNGVTVLLELQNFSSLQFLKVTNHQFSLEEELSFQSYGFGRLQRLYFDVKTVPKIVIEKNAMKGLKSLQLLCEKLGEVSGILHLDQLNEVILPNRNLGVGRLSLEVSKHSNKPKIIYADGSRQGALSRMLGFRKPEDAKEPPHAAGSSQTM